ncbi:MAG TPA: hypothetical protein VGG06_05215 [Thermoanaerobaculia bacterium]|jgi:hypothetical protein
MTELWIEVVLPWPWWICVFAAAAEILLVVTTLPRWLRILRDQENREGGASRSYIQKILLAQRTILGLSALAVASLYGYDLCTSQMDSALLGEEVFQVRGTLAGLKSLVPILVGLGMWGWVWLLVGRRSRNKPR